MTFSAPKSRWSWVCSCCRYCRTLLLSSLFEKMAASRAALSSCCLRRNWKPLASRKKVSMLSRASSIWIAGVVLNRRFVRGYLLAFKGANIWYAFSSWRLSVRVTWESDAWTDGILISNFFKSLVHLYDFPESNCKSGNDKNPHLYIRGMEHLSHCTISPSNLCLPRSCQVPVMPWNPMFVLD